ncbi:MAG: two-component regulator propeller domain-containing protein [Microscillaceae bacterium]|nr:two-component regulator propeller domain-containing protein [Microscillaceae bacterium]
MKIITLKPSKFILIFWGILWPFSLLAQPKTLEFERLTLRDGLSQSHVYCILQDKQGFMWFGTQDGLNRFDGYDFKIYKKDLQSQNTLSNNQINSLATDLQQYLWIGTDNGLSRYDYRQDSFMSFIPEKSKPGKSLLDPKVNTLLVDKKNNLWIGTPAGLNRMAFNKKSFDFVQFPELNKKNVLCILEEKSGQIWVGTDSGLFKLNDNTQNFIPYTFSNPEINSLKSLSIQTIFQTQNGQIWVGTSKGLLVLENSKASRIALKSDKNSQANDYPSILSLQSDGNGFLWIGTEEGLFILDLQTRLQTHYLRDSKLQGSLSSNHIFNIYRDRTNIMWLGTYIGGINKYDPRWRNFTHVFQDNSGLSSNNVKSFCEGADNSLWIATYQGGLNRYDRMSKEFTVYKAGDAPGSLKDNDIQVVYKDSKGTIWVGTKNTGLCKLNPDQKTFTYYPVIQKDKTSDSSKSLLSAYIRAIYEDTQHNLWVGTWDGGLSKITFKNNDYTIRHYLPDSQNPGSIRSNSIYSLMQDRSGIIWVGTRGGGLNKFDPKTEKFTAYLNDPKNPQSISNDKPLCIFEDSKNRLWVGTYGAGMNLFDRKKNVFIRFGEKEGLPNDVAYGILEDNQGNLWISTNKGLAKFDPDKKAFSNYDVFDGLQSNEFNGGAFFKSQTNGQMFFGGINGFTHFDPDKIESNKIPPPVILTDFQVFNQSLRINDPNMPLLKQHISETETLTLNYNQSFFSLEFVALNYTHTEKNKYEYRLVGFKNDTLNYTYNRRLVTYTNLDPGNYTFQVRASNNDGVWSKIKSLKIYIRPPFWQTWWFRITATLIGLSLAYAIYLYRIRRIQQRKEELEYEVKIQTAQINQQKEEILATLENLKTTQAQLLESDKMASLGQLTAGIAHEINNPINFVYAGTSSLKANINDLIEVLEAYGEISPQNVESKLKEIMELKEDMEFEEILEEINDLTDSIRRGAERTAEIVKGLRTFSRLDEDDIKLADMHENLDATISILRNQVKNRIELVKEYGTIPSIECYPGKLNQVFMNIISNAIQAIKDKGTITIKTFKKDEHFIGISIRDSGSGMPEEVKKRIFEPFFTTKDVGKGTGLGLSITHSIMEKHHGKIEVESEIGVGTEFILILPIRQNKVTTQANVSEQSA